MLEKVRRGEVGRAEQRTLAGNTLEVPVDGQGRINIDRVLRDFAGLELGSKVIVAGSFDRVEIWDPARYDRQTDEGGARIKGAAV
jgi:MraZ protein